MNNILEAVAFAVFVWAGVVVFCIGLYFLYLS